MTMYDDYSRHGYALLRAYTEKHNPVKEAVDFLVEHCTDARWDIVSKAMETLEKGFKKKIGQTKTDADKWVELVEKGFEREFKKDMIYYTICYDGFRL